MNKRTTTILGTGAVALVAFAAAFTAGWRSHRPGAASQAAWEVRYGNAAAMLQDAQAIVIAEAKGSFVTRTVQADDGQDTMIFEAVHLAPRVWFKGNDGAADLFVERAATIAGNGHDAAITVDGGPYETGMSYLLFLKRQPETGLYYVINDQARFEVEGNTLAGIDPDDRATSAFHGKTVSEAGLLIEAGLALK